ncbi:hypothetical protein ACFYXL_03770 [Streptomyces tsukubensis]|uniref:hypothetical protein n=1 Tax=Streptomyces tsukubensis TaxID=83656 RepID=UPI0036D1BAFD
MRRTRNRLTLLVTVCALTTSGLVLTSPATAQAAGVCGAADAEYSGTFLSVHNTGADSSETTLVLDGAGHITGSHAGNEISGTYTAGSTGMSGTYTYFGVRQGSAIPFDATVTFKTTDRSCDSGLLDLTQVTSFTTTYTTVSSDAPDPTHAADVFSKQ